MINNRAPRIKKICPVCQSEFSTVYQRATYCSKKCANTARDIKKGLGITAHYWQGLREFVIERDDFTCQDCGAFMMGMGLVAHHIRELYKSGSNAPENLITVCDKCHKRRHSL